MDLTHLESREVPIPSKEIVPQHLDGICKFNGRGRNVFVNATTICMANVPSLGFVAINSVNERTYTINTLTSYELHKGRILDGVFFSTESHEFATIGEDRILSVHDLKMEPPELRMASDLTRNFPDLVEIPDTVRWSPLDPTALLAFSRHEVVIFIRGKGHLTPIFCKRFAFEHILDAQFLPFAGNYLAVLSGADNMIHIIDWQSTGTKVETRNDLAHYKVKAGVDQLYMCGLHINERSIKMGEYNHMLVVSPEDISLIDIPLGEQIIMTNLYEIPLLLLSSVHTPGVLCHFDIYYSLLYILYPDNGKLYIYQYKHTMEGLEIAHSLEEVYSGVIEVVGKVTGLSAVMEEVRKIEVIIRIVVADTQGLKFSRINVNRQLPRVDEKILDLEVFRAKSAAVEVVPAPEIVTKEPLIPGPPPGLIPEVPSTMLVPEPVSESAVLGKPLDIFPVEPEPEKAVPPPTPQVPEDEWEEVEEKPTEIPEETKAFLEEVKIPTGIEPRTEIPFENRLAELMGIQPPIAETIEAPPGLLPEKPRVETKEIGVNPMPQPVVPRIDVEDIKTTIKQSIFENVRSQFSTVVMPSIESTFKQMFAQVETTTNADVVKFSKQFELQSARIESMCSLYEMNMENIMKKHTEYTEMVKKIIQENKEREAKAALPPKVQEIPKVSESFTPGPSPFVPEAPPTSFIPKIPSIPKEEPGIMRERPWGTGPEVNIPFPRPEYQSYVERGYEPNVMYPAYKPKSEYYPIPSPATNPFERPTEYPPRIPTIPHVHMHFKNE